MYIYIMDISDINKHFGSNRVIKNGAKIQMMSFRNKQHLRVPKTSILILGH